MATVVDINGFLLGEIMSKDDEHAALSPAEWEVMKTLWDGGPLDARSVFAALPKSHDWAFQTVKTLLSRMVVKGAVAYDQVGNSYLYRAAVPREELTRQEVQSVLDRVVGAAVSPVLAHFIDEAKLSDDEIQKLQQLLDEKRKKRPGGKSRRGKSQ
jgi:BlaI family penicillinase repressor